LVVWFKVPLDPLMVRVSVPVGVLPLVVIARVEVHDGPHADLGLKLAVERAGRPATLKLTLPEKPLRRVTVTKKLTFEP
jgi:hypothetical protein